MSFPNIKPATSLAIILLLISLVLRWCLPSLWIENLYSRGLFPIFRTLWDYSLGFSPVPLFYLFWLVIAVLLVRGIRKAYLARNWRARLWRLCESLCCFSAYFILVFLWAWGFNYGRQTVEEKIKFSTYEMDFKTLTQRVIAEADTLRKLRTLAVGKDTTAVEAMPFNRRALETSVRALVEKALLDNNYPVFGRPRGRQLLPKGVLLRLSTSGVYWPWVGEGNLDAGMHPLKKPSVLAHELAHAYGFGEEGTCSFWAWLAGQQADDPWLAYAIRLDYWRNLARQWLRTDPGSYLTFYHDTLATGIKQDIIAIVQTNQRYPDILPQVRDVAYDTYLKSQGVKSGLLSYGRVVQLVEGYRKYK